MSDREHQASVRAAIASLHAAMAKVANGDVSAIKALYSHSDDASSFYGWGGYEKGWAAVARRWDWAGSQFQGGAVRHENISTVIGADMFFTTDVETYSNQRVAGVEGRLAGPTASRMCSAARMGSGAWSTAMPTDWKRSSSRRRG
jgi:hypothetical protein